MNMSFDQYQRYKTTELIIKQAKRLLSLENLKILEIGANEEENLEKVLPNEVIYYSDIKIPLNLQDKKNFFILDATQKLDIKDNEFDVVVALDVFEHIDQDKRKIFISELNRISRYVTIISFPENNDYVVEAEKEVNDYYLELTGKEHPWLSEHINIGLPKVEDVLSEIDADSYYYFTHGDAYIWKELIKIYILMEFPKFDKEAIESINSVYINNYFLGDGGEFNYRGFLILTKEKELVNTLKSTEIYVPDIYTKKREWMINKIVTANRKLMINRSYITEEKPIILSLFYDTGAGYNSDEVLTCKAELNRENNKYHVRFNIDKDVKAIRFDPVEGYPCLVKILSYESNVQINGIYPVNATEITGSADEFLHVDPIYAIEGNVKGIKFLDITAEIIILELQVALGKWNLINFRNANRLREMQQRLESTQETLYHTEVQVLRMKEKLKLSESEFEVSQQKLILMEEELKIARDQIITMQTNIESMQATLNSTREHIEGIQASLSWRVTKPLRAIKRVLKRETP